MKNVPSENQRSCQTPRSRAFRWLRWALIGIGAVALAANSPAMRIILTNDDGFENRNVQALFTALKAAGHDVLLSAPFDDQSGMSAAVRSLTEFPPTTKSSAGGRIPAGAPGTGPTTIAPDQFYVNSSPAMAVLYGIDVLARAKWGARPDLVISGPNAGNNMGTFVAHSGTVGAAVSALNRGIPAIAVGGANDDSASAPLLADIALRVIGAVVDRGKVLLPDGVGLNVNVPSLDSRRTADSLRFAFTQVVSDAAGASSANPVPNETDAFRDGQTVTVSPIQGTYRATAEESGMVLALMRKLFGSTPLIDNPKFVNVSVRGYVGAQDAIQIIGFSVSGSGPKTVLIRASGPALAAMGVSGWLEDPVLQLFSGVRLIAENDNWSDDAAAAPATAAASARAGAFPLPPGSRDSALLITLSPGDYTVVIKGVGGATGVALAEVYDAHVD